MPIGVETITAHFAADFDAQQRSATALSSRAGAQAQAAEITFDSRVRSKRAL
jgi:hypothetical protein